MARETLPKNTDAKFETDATGVAPVAPTRRIATGPPRYPSRARVGGYGWSFGGLSDGNFPSPNNTGWTPGWVSHQVRTAMMNHHKVYQAVNNLINGIVGEGGRTIPCISPYGPDKADFKMALKVAQFCDRAIRQMQGAHWISAKQLCHCTIEGNKIAPIDFREQTRGRDKGKLVLDRLNVWDNEAYEFSVDEYGDFVSVYVNSTDPKVQRTEYPRSKFIHLAWRPNNNDPYGTQILAPAYNPFYKDVQIDSEEMAYVSQFGRPSVIIFASPPPDYLQGAEQKLQPLYSASGEPIMEFNEETQEMEQRLGTELEQNALSFTSFGAGSIWSMEAGSLVQVVEARNGGADMYRFMREQDGRSITGVILGTHQATDSERNMSTNNSEVGEGIMGLNITEGKRMLELAEENDLLTPLVRWNFGEAALDYLPIRDYGSGQNGRVPKILNATQGFASNGSLTRDQYWWFCAGNWMPLPYPDDEPVIAAARIAPVGTGGGDKTTKEEKLKPEKTGGGSGE